MNVYFELFGVVFAAVAVSIVGAVVIGLVPRRIEWPEWLKRVLR
jgi:hypothetical protein